MEIIFLVTEHHTEGCPKNTTTILTTNGTSSHLNSLLVQWTLLVLPRSTVTYDNSQEYHFTVSQCHFYTEDFRGFRCRRLMKFEEALPETKQDVNLLWDKTLTGLGGKKTCHSKWKPMFLLRRFVIDWSVDEVDVLFYTLFPAPNIRGGGMGKAGYPQQLLTGELFGFSFSSFRLCYV